MIHKITGKLHEVFLRTKRTLEKANYHKDLLGQKIQLDMIQERFFDKISKRNLYSCHEDLKNLGIITLQYIDIRVKDGYRGKEAQDKAVEDKRSKVPYPQSPHNLLPSKAMDITLYNMKNRNTKELKNLQLIIEEIAREMKINIKVIVQKDQLHVELKERKN